MMRRITPPLRRVVGLVPVATAASLCAVSLGALAFALLTPIEPDEAAAPDVVAPDVAPSIALAEPAPFVPDALVTKPLFSPNRAPPQPPAPPPAETPVAVAPPPPPEEPAPAYSLRGIVATPLTRKVLLRRDDQSKPIWLAEGDRTPEGWTLSRVAPDGVSLSKSAHEIELRLKPKRGKKSQFAIR